MLGRFFKAIVLVTILSGTAQAVLIIPIDPPPPPPPPVPAVSLIGLNPISSDPGVFATGPTHVLGIETSPFSVSTIGTVVGEMLSGLDLQPGTGQLFASSGQNGANPGHLFTVNSNTGAATLVGAIEILGINAPVGVPGLAFDQGGTLYGGTTSPSPGAPPMLITIDPVTGAGTVVGSYGFSGGRVIQGLDGIAIDPTSGTLYGISGGPLTALRVTSSLLTSQQEPRAGLVRSSSRAYLAIFRLQWQVWHLIP